MASGAGREPALVDVGYGGAVALERVVAIGNPDSAPVQRALRRAEKEGRLVDLSFGRRVRAVLFLDSGHVVAVAAAAAEILAMDPVLGGAVGDGGGEAACSTS